MRDDPRGVRIDSLGIPKRMVKACANNGFYTLGDIASVGVANLLGPGIGPETARTLRCELDRHGIEHDIPRRQIVKIYER